MGQGNEGAAHCGRLHACMWHVGCCWDAQALGVRAPLHSMHMHEWVSARMPGLHGPSACPAAWVVHGCMGTAFA